MSLGPFKSVMKPPKQFWHPTDAFGGLLDASMGPSISLNRPQMSLWNPDPQS